MDILVDERNVIIDAGLIYEDDNYIEVIKDNGDVNNYPKKYTIHYNIDSELIFEVQKHLYINGIIRVNPKYVEI